VIGRSFSVWFRNFVPFSLVTLAVHVPVFALSVLASDRWPGWDFIFGILFFLSDLVVSGALTFGVLESLRGRRASVGALFRKGFGKMGSVFGTVFRIGMWLFLGGLLLVIPAIVLYCALYVAVPAAVVEDVPASSGEALARSRALTKGHRWGIFGVVLVMVAVSSVGTTAANVLFAASRGFAPVWLQLVVVNALAALLNSLDAAARAVAYHDLRVAKEGLATADLVKVFE
jgi:hypothetical protein